jgi:hypothetical protein
VKTLLAALLLAALQSSASVDPRKLEELRKMSPEERQKLKAKLVELKALPTVERARLQDNLTKIKTMPAEEVKKLREKAQKLSVDEQKEYSDLAGGFFKWAHRMGYARDFPRGQFFQWLKNQKPGEIAEIRAMEPGPGSPRVDRFLKLFHEFRGVATARVEQHLRQHKCSDPAALGSIRELPAPEFWPKWQELQRACQARRPAEKK